MGRPIRDTNTDLADLDFTKPRPMATRSDSAQRGSSPGRLTGGKTSEVHYSDLGSVPVFIISSAGGEEDGTKRVVLPNEERLSRCQGRHRRRVSNSQENDNITLDQRFAADFTIPPALLRR